MTCHSAISRAVRDEDMASTVCAGSHDDLTFFDAPMGLVHCRKCGGDYTAETLWRVPCPAKVKGTPF